MVGLVTLSEWLACMVVDFLVGMDMGVMATVKSMAAMVEEKVMVAAMAAMGVVKDMARAAKTTATRDMATVGTDVPLVVLRPTTHPLLLLITLQPTPINQCRVMVLTKPTSHLRVTSLADLVVHRTLLVDCTHPDNVTDLCQSMANSRIMEDIMLASL